MGFWRNPQDIVEKNRRSSKILEGIEKTNCRIVENSVEIVKNYTPGSFSAIYEIRA